MNPRRNKFSLSHNHIFTCSAGELVPAYIQELLPGDSVRMASSFLIRCGVVPLAPIMSPMIFRAHIFDVPYNLIWDNWPEFCTGFDEDGDASTATWPYRTLNTNVITESSLDDYLGVPVIDYTGKSMKISALPVRAYSLLWNEFYRDAQVVDAITVSKADGADSTTNTSLKNCMWHKDWVTTIRPSPQIGSDITLPVGTKAPVYGVGSSGAWAGTSGTAYETEGTASTTYASYDAGTNVYVEEDPNNSGYPNIFADLSNATGLSVTALREYFALQRYAENLNERGHRYGEYLNWAFGIKGKKDWLPQYVSGGKKVMNWSEVVSTGGADDGSNAPVGQLRGHGIGALRTRRSIKFIKEHTLRLCLVSMVPKAIYADGMPRMYLREDKEDYFTKELELMGDRAVTNKEIYADHTTPDGTFGYQHRYDSYRSGDMLNRISGEFQSSLSHWHYARMYSGDPSLNETFLTCNPTKRQYADNSSDTFQVFSSHSVQVRRQAKKNPRKRIL
jgi:hypothetical protein